MKNILNMMFSKEKNDSEKERTKIKSGFDKSGNPYIDLTDKKTAEAFMEKAKRFEKIKTV